jgi:hypothetical protein
MAGADDENMASLSEEQEEEKDTETGSGQPTAAADSDQGEDQQPKKKRQVKRRCQIDWLDQSTLSPSKPKNFMTIEDLENEKKAKKKEQMEITKAAKAAKRKQKALADKASHLTNEELLEIVQQRRHRQQEKANKGTAKASATKKASNRSRASTG